MQYRKDMYGNELSLLGFGCMRWTTKAGKIDLEKAEKEVLRAIELGVNYFDTAYVYGGSEETLGKIISRNNLRDKIKIATKLPHYLLKKKEDLDKYFNEELKRLQTDHVDYYLMHMLTDVKTWQRLVDMGVAEWLEEKKKSGQIRQVGFSYHGGSDMFIKLIDAYNWEFTQIQYNYMDENSQAGRKGLNYAASKNIPVIIMEPLRGGKLVSRLPEKAVKLFNNHTPKHTPADWAFRWLYDQPEVTVVLSGMNSIEMIEENCQTASDTLPGSLNEADQEMLKKVVSEINAKMKVGCTGCGYCMPCPKGVDIPGTFAAYNRCFSEGKFDGFKDYVMCTALRKDSAAASLCVGCGKCEQHCPQHIEIRNELKNAKKKLEGPVYKLARWIILKMRAY